VRRKMAQTIIYWYKSSVENTLDFMTQWEDLEMQYWRGSRQKLNNISKKLLSLSDSCFDVVMFSSFAWRQCIFKTHNSNNNNITVSNPYFWAQFLNFIDVLVIPLFITDSVFWVTFNLGKNFNEKKREKKI
jgi:hypothetical protein